MVYPSTLVHPSRRNSCHKQFKTHTLKKEEIHLLPLRHLRLNVSVAVRVFFSSALIIWGLPAIPSDEFVLAAYRTIQNQLLQFKIISNKHTLRITLH